MRYLDRSYITASASLTSRSSASYIFLVSIFLGLTDTYWLCTDIFAMKATGVFASQLTVSICKV